AEGPNSKQKKASEGSTDGKRKQRPSEGGFGDDSDAKTSTEEGDEPQDSKDKGAIGDLESSSKKSDPSRGLREKEDKKKKEEQQLDRAPKGELTESEDKFKRLMKEALKSATSEADPDIKIDIDDVEKIGVIPMNSSMISGYVVISRSGIGFDLGSDLLDTLLEAIETTFSTQGIEVTCQSPFIMETQKFTFDFWRENMGLFTIFEQSQREEIALTFLQTSESVPEMVISKPDPNMVTIQVKDIDIEIPVEFKTYL
ncbi:MAG: hypothetical protein AAF202_08025, partial [Pseudomonadota bacterium]